MLFKYIYLDIHISTYIIYIVYVDISIKMERYKCRYGNRCIIYTKFMKL